MSGMISFYIQGGLEEANSFLSNLKIFSLAISLGSVESIAQLPILHVGCEDKQDLINDLDQALKIAIPCLPTKTCLQD
uniref:cystathionine gamma-lyase n=1 Tax=Ditylenchus dipsaci TaxID=166011 RepID=A0A915EIY8_9BILA